jgi:hypothetical protein
MENKLSQKIIIKLFNTFPNFSSEFDLEFPDLSPILYEFTTQYLFKNINNEDIVKEFIRFLNLIINENDSYLSFTMIDSIFYPIYEEEKIYLKILNKLKNPLKDIFINKKKEKQHIYYIQNK